MTGRQSALRHGFAALCVLAAGAAASGNAVAAGPNPTGEVRSVVVRYYVQDLSNEQGSRVVYSSLKAAARQVCGRFYVGGGIVAYRTWWTCYSAALDKAVAELDNNLVTALHSAASPRVRVGGGPAPSPEHRG